MASRIDLDLAHAYQANPQKDSDYALLPLQISFLAGGAYALLGPSGCGKTTMLNLMSGLIRPSQGSVLFDGVDVTDKSPQERNIAQVFQFPVIYDTMTVAENLAFPLRNRRMKEAEIRKRVEHVAEMLELSAQLKQRASGLTADAKQKISLGRGLVRSDVSAILFDEPLTVIDPHLKWQLRRKLKEVHQELKLTLVYVTHDQVEALTFAQEVVVMARGKALQTGTAEALFEKPAHSFVGHFIGSPGMNFLTGEIADQALIYGDRRLRLSNAQAHSLKGLKHIKLGIRPEYVSVQPEASEDSLPAQVEKVQDLGTSMLLTINCAGQSLRARLPLTQLRIDVGTTVHINILGNRTCFYHNEELVL